MFIKYCVKKYLSKINLISFCKSLFSKNKQITIFKEIKFHDKDYEKLKKLGDSIMTPKLSDSVWDFWDLKRIYYGSRNN